jgi:polysaccharide chain length determinant protein (PEP-CTERM system associated)
VSTPITVALIHARSLWRRRWYGVAVAWAVCLGGWALVFYLPDQYEAKARIYVDTESMLQPLLRGIAADMTLLAQVDVMQRTWLSRPNLQKVSHMADLELAARTPAESEAVINDLRRRITLSAEGRNLYSLSYVGPNRETAINVVQAMLSVFVENNLGNSRQDMASAQQFIDNQLSDYAKELDLAESRIAEFKAQNLGFLPGDSNYNNKLDLARQEFERDKADLDENRRKRDELAKQLASVPRYTDSFVSTTPGDDNNGPPLSAGPPLGGDATPDPALHVAELEKKLADLLENYTDEHPDVVRVRRQLEQARQQAARADAERAASAPPDMPAVDPRARRNTLPNPVYEQLQLQLLAQDSTIATLEARVSRAQAEVDKWEHLAKSVPEVGAEMAKLTRDYDVKKKAYDELLNRHESAKIGGDMETQTPTVQFRIVDPPVAPTEPVAPKRGLLFSVVLIGGAMAGVAFCFLLTQIDDSVTTVRQLKEVVTVPVLGAISLVTNASRSRHRRGAVITFTAICMGLVAVYAGVMALPRMMGPHAEHVTWNSGIETREG